MRPKLIRLLLLCLPILLLAAGLRFHRLEAQSFWNDEGNSARLAERSPRLILEGAAGDIHPPGYYLLLKVWRTAAGESEFALRSVSAFAGVVLAALAYRLGRVYFDSSAGIAAALLAAVNPFLAYYSQEARMYMLAGMLGSASFLLFSAWLHSSRPPNRALGNWRLGTGYVLVTAAGLYTHYAFPFVIASQNLAALGGLAFHRRRGNGRRLIAWLGLQGVVLLLFLPWMPIAYRQVTTWPAAREHGPILVALADLGRTLLFGRTVELAVGVPGLVAGAVLLLLGLRRSGQTVTPLIWLALPVVLILGLGLYSEAFAKFAIVAVPALLLIMGNGLTRTTERHQENPNRPRVLTSSWSGLLVPALAAVVGLVTVRSLSNLYGDPRYFRDDYRGIARRIEAEARPGDAVILIAPNQWEVFTYYHREGTPVYPLPRARPLVEAETRAELESIAAEHSRLFVLYWGEAQADPNRFVESWLNEHAAKAVEEWHGQVRLATYAMLPVAADGPAVQTNVRFGDAIRLDGYTLRRSTLQPGDILQLTLYWRALAVPAANYTVFVHLAPDTGTPPLAQQDGEPGGGLNPTASWQPGQSVPDNHGITLPLDLPPGQYELRIGLYDPADGARLPVYREETAIGDSWLLEVVTIDRRKAS